MSKTYFDGYDEANAASVFSLNPGLRDLSKAVHSKVLRYP